MHERARESRVVLGPMSPKARPTSPDFAGNQSLETSVPSERARSICSDPMHRKPRCGRRKSPWGGRLWFYVKYKVPHTYICVPSDTLRP